MRVILTGVFISAGLMAYLVGLVILDDMDPEPLPGYVWVLVLVCFPVYLAAVAGVAIFLFDDWGMRPGPWKSREEQMRYLEENDLLLDERFEAVRAFGVQEFEDEGSAYYIELIDGRVLFLMGQYLYDYEPIEDGPENSQPRTFPCTKFTVRRHREEGYVYDIKCGGEVFEPEGMASWFGEEFWENETVPEDGEIITGRTYDDLKREHMGRRM